MGHGYPSSRFGLFPGVEDFGQELMVEDLLSSQGKWKYVSALRLTLVEHSLLLPFLLRCIRQNDISSGLVLSDGFKLGQRPYSSETENHFYSLVSGFMRKELNEPSKQLSTFISRAYGFQEVYRGRRGVT
jgi:hypothetical protein